MTVRQLRRSPSATSSAPSPCPSTRETLVAYANASGDQNPIHQDEAFAKSVGLPDVIAHGMWTMGAVRHRRRRLGRGRRPRRRVRDPLHQARRRPVVGRPRSSSQGVVKAVDAETGRVTVDLTTTCGGDKVLGRCIAVVRST